jgi:hypothetical protein
LLAESTGEPRHADGDQVDGASRPVYRGLYFNLARDEDLEILGWLLAIPRSRRMRAIKTALRTGLGSYAAARYPGLVPLPPDTVRTMLAPDRPTRSRLRDAPTDSATSVNARRSEAPSRAAGVERDSGSLRSEPASDGRVAMEARLDRLLQSFAR